MEIIRDDMYECCRWCRNYDCATGVCSILTAAENSSIIHMFENGYVYEAIRETLEEVLEIDSEELNLDVLDALNNTMYETVTDYYDDSEVKTDRDFCCVMFNK